jgi:hypothetical protein
VRSFVSSTFHNSYTLTEQAHVQSATHAAHTQALFDQLAEEHHFIKDDARDMSVDLITVTVKDEEKERLEAIKKQLKEEREKFTEAAIKLGRDKAALEVRYLD